MEDAELRKCQELLQYHFNNPDLLALALTHSSVASTRLESNERLEFLGDAVLGVVVCNWLYENQFELLEGDMTKIKSLVVSRHTCAIIAEETGLSLLLTLGKGMAGAGALPQSVSAAVFEAIIGAIFVDGGMDGAAEFVLRHVCPKIEEAIEDEHKRNFKSILQQHAQRRWSTTPEYQLLDEKGPDHSKCFEVAVVIRGNHFPSAWGASKKEAEQESARRALTEMGVIDLPIDEPASLAADDSAAV